MGFLAPAAGGIHGKEIAYGLATAFFPNSRQHLRRSNEERMSKPDRPDAKQSRRSFVKAVAWVAPAIVTLKTKPALAQLGSLPGLDGNPPVNDGPGTGPSAPGNSGNGGNGGNGGRGGR